MNRLWTFDVRVVVHWRDFFGGRRNTIFAADIVRLLWMFVTAIIYGVILMW